MADLSYVVIAALQQVRIAYNLLGRWVVDITLYPSITILRRTIQIQFHRILDPIIIFYLLTFFGFAGFGVLLCPVKVLAALITAIFLCSALSFKWTLALRASL